MTHDEKTQWMAVWCAKNGARLDLEGECGLGRECVGIVRNETFPDYGDECWLPEGAYHKHPCVAVLGRGEEVEAQLYEWLRWFDENEYTVAAYVKNPADEGLKKWDNIHLIFGQDRGVKMVKKGSGA